MNTIVALIMTLTVLTTPHQNEDTIVIPSIDVNAPIVDVYVEYYPNGSVTWNVSGLTSQVGFFVGTDPLAQGGNTVLGSHSTLNDNSAGVFYNLDDVSIGDEIIIYDDEAERRYTVTSVSRVHKSNTSILFRTDSEQLTIITCDTNNGNYRIVVIARPVL